MTNEKMKITVISDEQIAEIIRESIKDFCESVNDLACINMLIPPYKLEGQHKRAMVILCKKLGIELTFSDEV